MDTNELARDFLSVGGHGFPRTRHAEVMLKTLVTAGLNHPTVLAWLENRKKIKASKGTRDALLLIIDGADLWKAVADRAKRVNAARKRLETMKGKANERRDADGSKPA